MPCLDQTTLMRSGKRHILVNMSVQPEYFLWDVERYHRAIRAGVFTKTDKIELIEGALIPVPPIGPPHAAVVQMLSDQLRELVGSEFIIRVQSPITLPPRSEPEPDIVIAKRRGDAYTQRHPGPKDILVVIEVADSSLERDEQLKMPTYAHHGIGEYWLVVLETREFRVYTDPRQDTYRAQTVMSFDVGRLNSPAVGREITLDLTFLPTSSP